MLQIDREIIAYYTLKNQLKIRKKSFITVVFEKETLKYFIYINECYWTLREKYLIRLR